MARTLVNGTYKNPSTYVLRKEDGSNFLTIREGEPFKIGNQIRAWCPERVPKRNGKGTILVCRKYGDRGNLLEEFPLIHNKVGLWATTSGSARNGVFHSYRKPNNPVEAAIAEAGYSKSLIVQQDAGFEVTLTLGGEICSHVSRKHGYGVIHDGDAMDLTEPAWVQETHSNQYHVGCMCSTYQALICGATFAIYYRIGTTMNGMETYTLENVYLSPDADLKVVAEQIRDNISRV